MIFAKKTTMKLLLFFLFSIFFNNLFSQDTKSQAILDKLSLKMKSYKTFYLEFSAVIKNTASGQNDNQIGKGWVKGDKYFATFGENSIICNGIKTWSISKEDKSVYEAENDASDESLSPKKLLTLWEKGFKNKYEKESKLNAEIVHVINLSPKDVAKSDYHSIVLYISKTKNELKKATMKLKDGTNMTYSVTKLTVNLAIEDAKFIFDKKKYLGYSVIKD
jgi:outer membrane lipoprotein-sorting protein